MDALLDRTVEAHEEDAPGAQQQSKVDGLKAAVGSPAHHARLADLQLVNLADFDAVDAGDPDRAGLGYTKAGESGDAVVVSPPLGVAGVEEVCPGDESVGVVDGDPAGAWPRRVPRCFKVDVPV